MVVYLFTIKSVGVSQALSLPAIEDVPEKLQALLFKLSVIEPTWVNCLAFMEGDGFEVESLVGYLDRDIVRATILEHAIPSDPDSLPLRQLLFGAGSLSDDAYREYAHALPKAFKKLPEGLEPTKLQILIDERKITFTKESLDALVDNRDLQILFVAANIDTYLANPDSYALDDDFREGLLRSKIENAVKLRIVKLMDLNAIVNLPSRATLIGPIIQNTDVEIFDLNVDIIRSLIEHSRPIETQISLLNKYHAHLNDDEVRQFLTSLPQPFSEINTGYQVPRLENTPENQDLVRWLDSREIISSWSNSGLFTNDIRVKVIPPKNSSAHK